MALDDEHRKLIVGSDQGELKVFDINSGINTHNLHPHDSLEGEISYIGYGGSDHTIITIGWDQVMQVHTDEQTEHRRPQSKQKRENPENVLRGKVNCHRKDIISGDFARHLDLIATGGRDNLVKLWDYERVMLVHEYKYHESEVSIVRFIAPFPLLLTSDSSGLICIWLTKPHAQAGRLVTTWRNTLDLKQCTPISAIDSYFNAATREFLLFLGDELGFVRVQDISVLLEKVPNLEPVVLDAMDKKRNPHRVFGVDFAAAGKHAHSASSEPELAAEEFEQLRNLPPIVDESQIVQKGSWVAHGDVVKSIQYVALTAEPLVLTASADQFVHLWSFLRDDPSASGRNKGTLKQGPFASPDYRWEFEVADLAKLQATRSTATERMLAETR